LGNSFIILFFQKKKKQKTLKKFLRDFGPRKEIRPASARVKIQKHGEGLGRETHRPPGPHSAQRTETRPAPACAKTQNAAKVWAAKLIARQGHIRPKTL
jgi:hypothetical protein